MTFDEKNAELRGKLFTPEEQIQMYRLKAKAYHTNIIIPLDYTSKLDWVITGDVFVSLLHNTTIQDLDVFVLNVDSTTVSLFDKEPHYEKKESSGYNNNSSILAVYNEKNSNQQIIMTTYKTRKELLEDFDFIHCMISYHRDNLYITRQMYDAIMHKKLIPNKPKEDIRSYRINKYLERGFTWE